MTTWLVAVTPLLTHWPSNTTDPPGPRVTAKGAQPGSSLGLNALPSRQVSPGCGLEPAVWVTLRHRPALGAGGRATGPVGLAAATGTGAAGGGAGLEQAASVAAAARSGRTGSERRGRF